MARNPIRTNDIEPDTYGFVRGIVNWSRIASHIEGEELERENQRALARGQRGENGPYTRLTVDHASVVDYLGRPKPPEVYTTMDQYLQGAFFTHSNGEGGQVFTGRDKRRSTLPDVYEMLQDGTMRQIVLDPTQEIPRGSDVVLALQCYKPTQASYSNGISLRGVIIMNRAQTATSFADYLTQQGVVVQTAPKTVTEATVTTETVEQPAYTWNAPQTQPATQQAQTPSAPAQAPAITGTPAQAPYGQQRPQQNPNPFANPNARPQTAPAPAQAPAVAPWAEQVAQTTPAPVAQPNPFSYTPPAGPDPAMQAPQYPAVPQGQGLNPPIDETAF